MNPHQLLEHAGKLTRSRARETRQADCRRAVSAAYYALFHLLIQDAAGRFTKWPNLQPFVARKFEHGLMSKESEGFAKWKNPSDGGRPPESRLGKFVTTVPDELRVVAQAFAELQSQRHQADYDPRPEADFTRLDATLWVGRARAAFEAWERVREEQVAEASLLDMLFRDLAGR